MRIVDKIDCDDQTGYDVIITLSQSSSRPTDSRRNDSSGRH